MKKTLLSLTILMIIFGLNTHAQGTRVWLENYAIAGLTEDAQGANYLLLHKAYNGTLMADNYVEGTVTAIRGAATASNRKLSVMVYSSSAYNADKASILNFAEACSLVTLTYNGEKYVALQISNNASLYNFAFTGWATNYTLQLVTDNVVTNVASYTSFYALHVDGPVAIGTTSTGTSKLAVGGTIAARKIKVTQGGWPDYVFSNDYTLPSLPAVEKYIREHKHLPGIPAAAVVEKEGLDLGEMNKQLLQKIEELTLYILQLKKDSDAQCQMIQELQEMIKK